MPAERVDRVEHLFVVRLWNETPADEGSWRGSVEHVATGSRRYFVDLVELSEFLRTRRAHPGP